MNNLKITLESSQKIIEDHQLIINVIEAAAIHVPSNLSELICQRYIADQNVKTLADLLNSEGFRIGDRRFIGKDVSNVINESTGPLSKQARAFFNYNNTVKNGSRSFSRFIKELQGCEHL